MTALGTSVVVAVLSVTPSGAADIEQPKVLDTRLLLTLFAAEPEIVTPIGIAVDKKGWVFVVESHTHKTPDTYDGPKSDRIRVFEDADGDGKPERSWIFAEGFVHAMNLAFSPSGALHLVHRNGIVRLDDLDGDGKSDARKDILKLETAGKYPHNGIGGIAFTADGWLFAGIGENLGEPYKLRGSDKAFYDARAGEGGSVFRCRSDGTGLARVATGMWNPFGLAVYGEQFVLAVDNDPDSRPPNRLLDVVPGGDFGFRFHLGRNGLHPLSAWNGELPGTLPMAGGVGEAASAVLPTDKTNLPASYRNAVLVTSWGDHRIELHRLRAAGASLRAEGEVLIEGGPMFRPVGMSTAADGTLFFTDWVDRSYPVHKKGRIWRLAVKPGVAGHPTPLLLKPNADRARMDKLLAAESPKDASALLSGLTAKDPFIRSATTEALSQPAFKDVVTEALGDKDPRIRMGGLLAFRRTKPADPAAVLEEKLADPDESVRLAALAWVADYKIASLAPKLRTVVTAGPSSPRLLRGYAAASQTVGASKRTSATSSGAVVEAGARLDGDPASMIERLAKPGARIDLRQHLEAIRTLLASSHAQVVPALLATAKNRRVPAQARAEAIVALAHHGATRSVVALLADPVPAIRLEAARVLRLVAGEPPIKSALEKRLTVVARNGQETAFADQLRFALAMAAGDELPRPKTDDAWHHALGTGTGDREGGRRVFFHPALGCVRCHSADGHGAAVGPDLSLVGQSIKRDKVIDSILDPSREIAPQFVSYTVVTKDGQTFIGTLAGEDADGSLTLAVLDGGVLLIPASQIASKTASDVSLMPEGLEEAMTVQDFRDLLAYLMTREG